MSTVWTVGYERRSVDEFLTVLNEHDIDTVVDVRENAWSRKPGYTKSELRDHLNTCGIGYVHVEELGAPKAMRDKLDHEWDERDFFDAHRSYLAEHDMEGLKETLRAHRCALLCYERDVEDCHRKIIGERLENDGWNVIHL